MIRLRRPPVIQCHDERFVPDVDMAIVDAKWESLCQSNPKYVDGDIYHVLGVHRNGYGGATIQCAVTSYRFHAVCDCGIKPLGVNAICEHDGKLLLGKRSKSVHCYQGQWEFAPSGTVEPSISLEANMLKELKEETGLQSIGNPIACGIFLDEIASSWEVVFKLAVQGEHQSNDWEYDELQFFDVKELPKPLTPKAKTMRTLI